MADQERSRVLAALDVPAAAHGVEIVDVERRGAELRVTVDRPEGIDLDSLTAVTRTVTEALRSSGLLADADSLEVSSPGIERPLRTPAHYARAVGSKVAIRTLAAVDGERRFEGRLELSDDSGVVVDGRRFEYSDIERARTVFEWPATAKADRLQKAAR